MAFGVERCVTSSMRGPQGTARSESQKATSPASRDGEGQNPRRPAAGEVLVVLSDGTQPELWRNSATAGLGSAGGAGLNVSGGLAARGAAFQCTSGLHKGQNARASII